MAINWESLIGGSITDGVAKIISLFKVDPTIALEKAAEIEEIKLKMSSEAANAIAQQVQGQLEINKAEAESEDKFTSRWRPLCGYICAFALANNFIIAPFLTWISTLVSGHTITYPELDTSVMMPVLLGMLGLTAGHVYESVKGPQ
jgi:hypothetical protein